MCARYSTEYTCSFKTRMLTGACHSVCTPRKCAQDMAQNTQQTCTLPQLRFVIFGKQCVYVPAGGAACPERHVAAEQVAPKMQLARMQSLQYTPSANSSTSASPARVSTCSKTSSTRCCHTADERGTAIQVLVSQKTLARARRFVRFLTCTLFAIRSLAANTRARRFVLACTRARGACLA